MDPVATALIAIIGALSSAGLFSYIAKFVENRRADKKEEYNTFLTKYDVLWAERNKEYDQLKLDFKTLYTDQVKLQTKYEVLKDDFDKVKRESDAKEKEFNLKISQLQKDLEKEKAYNMQLKSELEKVKGNQMAIGNQ